MRICYIVDGGNIHTSKWLNYMADKGYEVHLIYWRTSAYLNKAVHFHQLSKILPQYWRITRYLSFLCWIFKVRRIVKTIKPDIIEAQSILDNGLLAMLSGAKKFIATAWGSDVLIYTKKNPIWNIIVRMILNKADAIICDSETVKNRLLELGARQDKISLIYNGIDTVKFNPNKKDNSWLKDLGYLGNPIIISTRNMRPIYNVEMLIRAVPLVLEKLPEARFVLVGDGEQKSDLLELAERLGILNSVQFLGYVINDKLPMYLASSDIYVSTSKSDSTSLSLLEAMACGLTPIVTDLPANREWIQGLLNGGIIHQDDYEELADEIICLIKDEEIRKIIGENNRKLIKNKAEYSKEMAKVENLYSQVIKNRW